MTRFATKVGRLTVYPFWRTFVKVAEVIIYLDRLASGKVTTGKK